MGAVVDTVVDPLGWVDVEGRGIVVVGAGGATTMAVVDVVATGVVVVVAGAVG